ncbi:hypothetical protein BC781_10813 [Sediminitomix flava]|uniref:Uncharacterized protein n=1 Tax=Sediminitomix flava TaxID=379075 RepID=A0A315Z4E0_SEDFL|nr:hypothetical protein BC781_10813 [Sediminitomix flava]
MEQYKIKKSEAKRIVYQQLPKKILVLILVIGYFLYVCITLLIDFETNTILIVTGLLIALSISTFFVVNDVKNTINELSGSYYELVDNKLYHILSSGDTVTIDLKNLNKITVNSKGIIIRTFNRKYYLSNKITNSSNLFNQIKRCRQ